MMYRDISILVAVLLFSLALTACGGGGRGALPPAAPIASGLASLVISEQPQFAAHQVYYWIIWNRDKARNGAGHNYDPGKVNYYYALRNLQ